MSQPSIAYIALGSNLGDRLLNLRRAYAAIGDLKKVEADSRRVASIWESVPVNVPGEQHLFFNSIMSFRTSFEPLELLDCLMKVEHFLGRVRGLRNECRVIDIDLILFGDFIRTAPTLTVPHPRMQERRFVLEPLAEIAGDVSHPVLNRTIVELRDILRRSTNQVLEKAMGPEWCLNSN